MRSNLVLPLLAPVLAVSVAAQIQPGHSITTVTVTSVPGEMYDVDHTAGTATPLTISATLAGERPNSVNMLAPVFGVVGTNPSGATGNIYSIQVMGGTVTEMQLNTTPAVGGNVAQVDFLGNDVWFCTQDAGGAGGVIQSVPLGTGPVTQHLDITSLGATGLANALCVLNGLVYVATFNSSPTAGATSPGELIEFDPVAGTGRVVLTLPPGGFQPVGNPWNTGIVNMHPDPQTAGQLVLQGVYGELLWIDPVAGTVVDQVWTGVFNAGGNALASGSVNSFDWDPVAQDWVIGTRSGTIERWVHAAQAEAKIGGVGSSTTPTQNSIGGLYYFPEAGGVDISYGEGCRGNGDWFPTDSSFGAPIAGNMNYKLGLFSANGGDSVVLLVDIQNSSIGGIPLPLSLGPLGAPSCMLRVGSLLAFPTVTTGTGEGQGQAIVPLPLPPGISGATTYRQWVEVQATPTNMLGAVLSNARQVVVQ